MKTSNVECGSGKKCGRKDEDNSEMKNYEEIGVNSRRATLNKNNVT